MDNIMIFDNSEFGEIRGIVVDNKVYFDGNEIAKILGYARPNDTIRNRCKGTIEHSTLKNSGGYPLKIIPEGDLYRLIIGSQLPSAEKFETWVMDEVLPQIRKTGGYIPVKEEDSDDEIMAKALMIASKTIEKKDELIEVMKPKVDNYERLLDSDGLMSWEQFVKSANLKIGRNKFMIVLRVNKVLLKNGMTPYQQYVDSNYFVVKQVPIANGSFVPQTFITREGLDWLMKKCKEWSLFKD